MAVSQKLLIAKVVHKRHEVETQLMKKCIHEEWRFANKCCSLTKLEKVQVYVYRSSMRQKAGIACTLFSNWLSYWLHTGLWKAQASKSRMYCVKVSQTCQIYISRFVMKYKILAPDSRKINGGSSFVVQPMNWGFFIPLTIQPLPSPKLPFQGFASWSPPALDTSQRTLRTETVLALIKPLTERLANMINISVRGTGTNTSGYRFWLRTTQIISIFPSILMLAIILLFNLCFVASVTWRRFLDRSWCDLRCDTSGSCSPTRRWKQFQENTGYIDLVIDFSSWLEQGENIVNMELICSSNWYQCRSELDHMTPAQ